MEYFFKELVSNAARLSDGREAHFEPIGDDNGVLATEDPALAQMLDKLIEARRGGVYRIDKETYDEALKKKPVGPLRHRPRMSDPPQPPQLVAVPDSRHPIANVGAVRRGEEPMAVKTPKPRSDAPTIKLPGFGVPPTPPPEAPKLAVKEPPSGDAAVNRPVPKKVAPSTQPPPKPPQ